MDGYASVIEVGADAEENFVQDLDKVLADTVFSAGCSNWYINKAGRNSAAWPGLAVTFWKATFFPRWNDFIMDGGSVWWPFHKVVRQIQGAKSLLLVAILAVAAGGSWSHPAVMHELTKFRSLLKI
jgi:hypothetical protein